MKSFWGVLLVIWVGIGLAQLLGCDNQRSNPSSASKPDFAKATKPDSMTSSPKLPLVKLNVPRDPGTDEVLMAYVSVGKLQRSEMISVRTSDGELLGSISLVGIRPGQRAGIYPIPIPRSAIVNQAVTLQLEVIVGTPETSRRPASNAEVEKVTVEIVPSTSGDRTP